MPLIAFISLLLRLLLADVLEAWPSKRASGRHGRGEGQRLGSLGVVTTLPDGTTGRRRLTMRPASASRSCQGGNSRVGCQPRGAFPWRTLNPGSP